MNRKPAKGTPWTSAKVDNLFYQIRNLSKCIGDLTTTLGSEKTGVYDTTSSAVVSGSIDDNESISTGPFTEAQQMRFVGVESNGNSGTLRIEIWLTNGDYLVFEEFVANTPQSWRYELSLSQAPIQLITVTDITGAAGVIEVIINVASKT